MFYPLIRSLLFLLDPEVAHRFSLSSLRMLDQINLLQFLVKKIPARPCKVMNLSFEHPVGIAAGFDKNGEYIAALGRLGFSHIEIGTVTPKPQLGNVRPRLFRLTEQQALINRMGFNNRGVEEVINCVKKTQYRGILGINIGKNATTPLENAVDDYQYCLEKVYRYASYVVLNISSPNTPGLRNLQSIEHLNLLLFKLKRQQHELTNEHRKYVPLVIKISPDLEFDDLKQMVNAFCEYKVDAIIATNTTTLREGVYGSKFANEQGGLSGKPLFNRATQILEDLNRLVAGQIPLIASGGILTPQDAQKKMDAGASLIQLYTGFIYKGPRLISDIVTDLNGFA